MKKPADKDKLLALVEMCQVLNYLEQLGVIKTAPDGERVGIASNGIPYPQKRKPDNIKFEKEHGGL